MRKSKILISILICIFLVGCSEKEEVKEEPIVESTQEIGKPFDFGVHSDECVHWCISILDTLLLG